MTFSGGECHPYLLISDSVFRKQYRLNTVVHARRGDTHAALNVRRRRDSVEYSRRQRGERDGREKIVLRGKYVRAANGFVRLETGNVEEVRETAV